MFVGAPRNHRRQADTGVGASLQEHDYFIKILLPATYISLIFHSSGAFLALSFLSRHAPRTSLKDGSRRLHLVPPLG